MVRTDGGSKGGASASEDLVSRLASAPLAPEAEELVLAACAGETDLDDLVSGAAVARDGPAAAVAAEGREVDQHLAQAESPVAGGVFLQGITVEGFRGIAAPATLELTPGPGLTLVVGRNGSGKSSFAEALELLLTGNNTRWAKRPAAWRQDWRNVHHPGTTAISAVITVADHPGLTVLETSWAAGADLADRKTTVQFKGERRADFSTLGWEPALEIYRPILSYNELGSILDDGPSKLFDSLARVLGVDEVVEVGERLDRVRKGLGEEEKVLRSVKAALLERLDSSSDDRAAPIAEKLRRRGRADLDAIEELLGELGTDDPEVSELGRLRVLATLHGPTNAEAVQIAAQLRAAAASAVALDATGSGLAREVAGMLEVALGYHESLGDGDCPVCSTEGALDRAWREDAATRLVALRHGAAAAEAAHDQLDAAFRSAREIVPSVPDVLDEGPARAAWTALYALRDVREPERLAELLTDGTGALVAELEKVRVGAAEELQRREDDWRPIEREVVRYLGIARDVEAHAALTGHLKQAVQWVETTANELRNERFAPVAGEAKTIWAMLRHQSNVDLEDIVLAGSKTARKVVLNVKVDGVSGAALGVMSQGELHALALSLFLPRATIDESPFRFVVVDDPVQSMDPARVDGLARVLEHVSETRQVVVFTHDERLTEAVRRLQIPARVLQVTRAARSVVEVRAVSDPAARALDDALAIMHTGELSEEVRRRVVPGFCRIAIEARCTDIVRRHLLAQGEHYTRVEEVLLGAERLGAKVGLALCDDAHMRNDEIGKLLERRFGKRSADAYFATNRGSHQPLPADVNLEDFIADVRVFVNDLATVP